MDNKLSELSKPVAWVLGTPACKHLTTSEEYADWYVEKMSTALPLYSQEYVSALLAELEAKDKRIAELSRLLAHNIERAEEAENRLSTPVRLPELCGDGENDNEYTEGLNDGINQSAKAIRAAGFTVEGDE